MVVGGGLAGLAASIEASRAGATVALMEKGNRIGGNSAKATSGTCFTAENTAIAAPGTGVEVAGTHCVRDILYSCRTSHRVLALPYYSNRIYRLLRRTIIQLVYEVH